MDLQYKLRNGRIDNIKATKLFSRYKRGNQRLYFILQDSHKKSTQKTVEEILDGNKLDFLFIDGDHSYDGVKRDFELWSSLVKIGGVIALHDIVPGQIQEPHAALPPVLSCPLAAGRGIMSRLGG